jgi:hypothetical protein
VPGRPSKQPMSSSKLKRCLVNIDPAEKGPSHLLQTMAFREFHHHYLSVSHADHRLRRPDPSPSKRQVAFLSDCVGPLRWGSPKPATTRCDGMDATREHARQFTDQPNQPAGRCSRIMIVVLVLHSSWWVTLASWQASTSWARRSRSSWRPSPPWPLRAALGLDGPALTRCHNQTRPALSLGAGL